jgi:hypothetical protein
MTPEHPPDEPLARYKINEAAKRDSQWTLFIFADRLEFEAADGRVRELPWDERHGRLQLQDRAFLMRRVVVAKAGKKSLMFQLPPEAFERLKAWYGPLTVDDLKIALKRRLGWVIPIGILFILGAAPIGPNQFEPVTFGLGMGLILTGTLSKLMPHRIFFLLDSLWFCTLAATSIVILIDDWGWLRAAFLALQINLAWRGFQEFHRFAPEPAPIDDPEMESA